MARDPDIPPMKALASNLALAQDLRYPDAGGLPPAPAPEVTDAELVEQVLAGDSDAFAGIVAR